jgi:hypothetical protein
MSNAQISSDLPEMRIMVLVAESFQVIFLLDRKGFSLPTSTQKDKGSKCFLDPSVSSAVIFKAGIRRHSFFSQIRFCYRHSYLWIASKLTSLSGVACHIFSPSEYETCLLIFDILAWNGRTGKIRARPAPRIWLRIELEIQRRVQFTTIRT